MDTIFPADSLEFCPQKGVQDVFVCGTYKLDEHPGEALQASPQRRRGQCLVFRTDNERELFAYVLVPFPSHKRPDESFSHQIQAIDLPAVLDMKWYLLRLSRISPLMNSQGASKRPMQSSELLTPKEI